MGRLVTLSPTADIDIVTKQRAVSPLRLKPSDVSIIVPVRDNTSGLKELLQSAIRSPVLRFRELIVVDDGSKVRLRLDEIDPGLAPRLHLVRTQRLGPAGARNKGASLATGDWLLFVDSDCLLTDTLLSAYEQLRDGSVGYAGHIKALRRNFLSEYYDSQRVLVPFGTYETGTPQHVVTANTLIWKKAFEMIGGFDETFHLAAGEDVDLGLRLRQVGSLRYVSNATILHDYGGLVAFCQRFFRYGRANAMLEKKYSVSFYPRRQSINNPSLINRTLTFVQYLVTLIGYHFELRKI